MKKVFSEYFSHWPIMLLWGLFLACFGTSYALAPERFFSSLWILLIPVLLAPFYEWVLHKFALHRIVDPDKSPAIYKYMLDLHYSHHWKPADLKVVFAPFSAAISVVVFWAPVSYLVFPDLPSAFIFEGGVIAYFCFYEWIHLAHHMPSYRAITPYGRLIRNSHTWHHHKNENFWWGVTNPLGDYVFGTFKDPKEVEFSPSAKSLGDLQKFSKK
jgi:hypothetical protein